MIRFRMLGTVDLRDSEGRELRSVLRRPKLLALLGYLAAARPVGFHRRDTLVALLWPELDNAHARNALRQAMHALREAVGQDALPTRGEEELGVSDEHLWCDVRELERSLAADEAESALGLYGGGLLNGLHVSDAPEFERWLDEEREYLRRRACEAAQGLVDRAAASGNAVGATRWAFRLTELSPFDENAVRRLIQLLDQAGDQAGAVRAYEEFERRIGRDLEVHPSAETRELVQAIRARRHPNTPISLVDNRVEPRAPQPTMSEVLAQSVAASPRRRGAVLLTVLVVSLVSGGWLLAREHARNAAAALEPRRLVVLPFTNLGPADQEYFADGMTEEIAARLSPINRLLVIGRSSANRYKRTEKTIPEIGRELGVSYVLEGSVRWETSPKGRARIRVTPQLVRTTDGMRLWAEVYDESPDEIFRVQSDIAQKVVRALDVILIYPQRRTVEAVPTRSLEAYDFYLRGNQYLRRGLEPRYANAAVQMYEKAVALDPKFTLAYARLARVNSRIYWFNFDRSEDRLARAKAAIDKAVELEPDRPEVRLALGAYYWMCYLDYDRALQELAIAEVGLPNETDLLGPRAVLLSRKGEFRKGFEDYERMLQLDPGSALFAFNYAADKSFHRDYAQAESLYDRAIALAPDWNEPYFEKAGTFVHWEGNTKKARAILEQVQAIGVSEAPTLLWHLVRIDLLDRKYQDALGHLAFGFPEAINWHFQFIARAQLYADVYALMHRQDLAQAYYDSARTLAYKKLQQQPNDARLHSALGIAYAGLGRKEEAIKEGRIAVELMPVGKEAEKGYYSERELARIYTMVGQHDAALERLEHLLSIPGEITPAWLRIDPTWDPLRGEPRFQRLVSRAN